MNDLSPITPASSIEQIAANKGILQAMKARIKELEAQHKEQMAEYIEANGPTTVGEIRYCLGYPKETESHDHPLLADEMMARCNGDWDEFCSHLVAQPFKPGSCRSLLGEVFNKFFTVTEKTVLKEGKPAKQVLSVPTNLLAQRSAT